MERQALIEASVQPGGRRPAPEPLELVQAFVNTVDREHGPDLLDDLASWRAWCTRRALAPDEHRDEVRAVREALRTLLWANVQDGGQTPSLRADVQDGGQTPSLRANVQDGGQTPSVRGDSPMVEGEAERDLTTAAAVLDRAARLTDLRPRFGPPARLEAFGAGAVGTVLAAAFGAMADGSWKRLKACPGPHCGWAFYDRSVNVSAGWCSMRICGGRAKARAYYLRQRS